MKKIQIILISFIFGFLMGRIPLSKIKNQIFMVKLKSITVIDGDTVYAVNNNNIEK